MSTFVVVLLGAVSLGVLLVMGLHLRRQWNEVIGPITKGMVVTFALLLGLPAAGAVVVSAINRHQVVKEREARVQAELEQLVTKDRLRRVESRLDAESDRKIRAVRRTFNQRIADNLKAIRDCGRSGRCRVGFARLIRTVVRANPATGDIVPAPPTRIQPPRAPVLPVAPSQGPTRAQILATVRQACGGSCNGRDGKDGRDGQNAHPVDSGIIDGLDNRLTGLEQRVEGLREGLCRSPLARALVALKVC